MDLLQFFTFLQKNEIRENDNYDCWKEKCHWSVPQGVSPAEEYAYVKNSLLTLFGDTKESRIGIISDDLSLGKSFKSNTWVFFEGNDRSQWRRATLEFRFYDEKKSSLRSDLIEIKLGCLGTSFSKEEWRSFDMLPMSSEMNVSLFLKFDLACIYNTPSCEWKSFSPPDKCNEIPYDQMIVWNCRSINKFGFSLRHAHVSFSQNEIAALTLMRLKPAQGYGCSSIEVEGRMMGSHKIMRSDSVCGLDQIADALRKVWKIEVKELEGLDVF